MSLPEAAPVPFSLSGIADRAWNAVVETSFRAGWTPLARVAEVAVISVMKNIAVGHLRVRTRGSVYDFPNPELGNGGQNIANKRPNLKAEIRVVNDAFWVRLCTMSDLGFAEAFMYGDVECDDLVPLFQIFLENRENLANLNSRFSYLFTLPQKITSYRFLNTISNSRSNISAHYDISNDMFAGFLSEDMTYSCAIFPELDGDLNATPWNGNPPLKRKTSQLSLPPSPPSSEPDESRPETVLQMPLHIQTPLARGLKEDPLNLAQIRKLQHIIDRLHIPPPRESGESVRILEIGSGWGALSIRIAQQFPYVEIDTLTLSSAQKELAEQRIAMADGPGLPERIRVHLMDYRKMPKEWEGRFARFVSVEMIEAVGREFMEEYWRVVDWAMERNDAVGVVQVITIPEALFPGGFLPTLTFLISTLSSSSKGRLVVDSESNIGPHYSRTLREWRRRFEDKFEAVIVPALQKEYAERTKGKIGNGLSREEIEVFKRKWIYYYCYCEIGFTTRTLGDHIITFMREGNQGYGCEVLA